MAAAAPIVALPDTVPVECDDEEATVSSTGEMWLSRGMSGLAVADSDDRYEMRFWISDTCRSRAAQSGCACGQKLRAMFSFSMLWW